MKNKAHLSKDGLEKKITKIKSKMNDNRSDASLQRVSSSAQCFVNKRYYSTTNSFNKKKIFLIITLHLMNDWLV